MARGIKNNANKGSGRPHSWPVCEEGGEGGGENEWSPPVLYHVVFKRTLVEFFSFKTNVFAWKYKTSSYRLFECILIFAYSTYL